MKAKMQQTIGGLHQDMLVIKRQVLTQSWELLLLTLPLHSVGRWSDKSCVQMSRDHECVGLLRV
jgi:hypothetical protein